MTRNKLSKRKPRVIIRGRGKKRQCLLLFIADAPTITTHILERMGLHGAMLRMFEYRLSRITVKSKT